MSLNLTGHKVTFSRILWWVIILLAAVFFIRVALWENSYYRNKVGAEREAPNVAEAQLDETEVTAEQRAVYSVPANNPRYLSIERLGIINARVLSLGIKSNGELATPNNIFDVGWYYDSSKPGTGGTVVIDGHNGGPNVEGVFKHLDELQVGDIIIVERGDGTIFNYEVRDNKEVPLSEADAYMAVAMSSPVSGTESVTLITCSGDWSNQRRTYLSRQFVRAVLIK